MPNTKTPVKTANVGLFRRIFAIFYDSFLLVAILFIVSAVATALNKGKAIETDDIFYPLYVMVVFGLSYLYFVWFWINGGQTLGMKTWQIQLHSTKSQKICWQTVTIRFFSALFSWACVGMGFFWSLIDKRNRCWHDLVSNTELVDLRKSTNRQESHAQNI